MSSQNTAASIIALPSVSSSLNALPRATSMRNVNIHQHMYAQRAAESEAKLREALLKTASAASQNQLQTYQPSSPSSSSDDSSPITITKTKTRFVS